MAAPKKAICELGSNCPFFHTYTAHIQSSKLCKESCSKKVSCSKFMQDILKDHYMNVSHVTLNVPDVVVQVSRVADIRAPVCQYRVNIPSGIRGSNGKTYYGAICGASLAKDEKMCATCSSNIKSHVEKKKQEEEEDALLQARLSNLKK